MCYIHILNELINNFRYLFQYLINHQSRKGSSYGFKAGLYVSDSGQDEKLEVSLGALKIII